LIDLVFSAHSVEAVLERLERDGSPFAGDTARLIRSRSPTSLKLAFRLVKEGKSLSRNECLKMEYRVASRAVRGHDFREGVRALLRDKDGQPKWQPSALAGVSESEVDGYFASLGADELCFSANAAQ
jgi:enoyl-CoA hydratase/carnithine racemase